MAHPVYTRTVLYHYIYSVCVGCELYFDFCLFVCSKRWVSAKQVQQCISSYLCSGDYIRVLDIGPSSALNHNAAINLIKVLREEMYYKLKKFVQVFPYRNRSL